MKLSRRDFVAGTFGLACLSAVEKLPAADPQADFPIIDTHIHIWDLKQLNPPWLATAPPVLRRVWLPEHYRQATAGLNVVGAVYVEIAEAPERRRPEAQFITDLIASQTSPVVAAVIAGDPAAEEFAQYIRHFAKAPGVRGIRFRYPAGAEADPKLLSGVRLLGELGLGFDLVMGAEKLAGAAKLAAACPDTRFILDHCAYGNPDWYNPQDRDNAALATQRKTWEEGIALLAERPNVACKISGVAEQSRHEITPQRLEPVVEYCLKRFGEDRAIFGTNWPVCLKAIPLADWVAAVRQITAGRGQAFQRKLFHANAVKWYRLQP